VKWGEERGRVKELVHRLESEVRRKYEGGSGRPSGEERGYNVMVI